KLLPPNSSSTIIPAQPIAAISCQRLREKPSGFFVSLNSLSAATGAFSVKNPLAASCSISCSSVRIRAMLYSPNYEPDVSGLVVGQFQDTLGNDVKLNFGRAAEDRIGTVIKPGIGQAVLLNPVGSDCRGFCACYVHPQFAALFSEFGRSIFQHG